MPARDDGDCPRFRSDHEEHSNENIAWHISSFLCCL